MATTTCTCAARDVRKTAEYYQQMFDAEIVESIQSDGRPQTDLDLNGLTIFIAPVAPDAAAPPAPTEPYVGLDHSGCAWTTWTKPWPSSSVAAPAS